MDDLPKISVVVITFNRLVTLKPTIESFLRNTDYPRDRLELIVTDDASPADVQAALRHMPFDKFCLGNRRGGLGVNTNRGLQAATGDLILHLQDDWKCCGPSDYLKKAVRILEHFPEVGLLTLHEHSSLPEPVRQVQFEDETVRIFSGIVSDLPPVPPYAYSDRPHLKTRAFIDCMGPYNENLNVAMTEVDFCRRFAAQNRMSLADLNCKAFFQNIGEQYSYNWPWKKRVDRFIRMFPGGNAALQGYSDYIRPIFKK